MKLIPNFKKPYISQIFFNECDDRRHIKITMCRTYPKEKNYFKHYIERSYIVKNRYKYSTRLINKYRKGKFSGLGDISFPLRYIRLYFLSPKEAFITKLSDYTFYFFVLLFTLVSIVRAFL